MTSYATQRRALALAASWWTGRRGDHFWGPIDTVSPYAKVSSDL
jgi:hypothetical protein